MFGDYISIYDIQRAVEDGATVPIYYESRLAELELKRPRNRRLDETFEEVTEGEEVERKEKLKTKWAALEALVGSREAPRPDRQGPGGALRTRLEAMDGKAMIVCMSRRICVDLYNAITRCGPSGTATTTRPAQSRS